MTQHQPPETEGKKTEISHENYIFHISVFTHAKSNYWIRTKIFKKKQTRKVLFKKKIMAIECNSGICVWCNDSSLWFNNLISVDLCMQLDNETQVSRLFAVCKTIVYEKWKCLLMLIGAKHSRLASVGFLFYLVNSSYFLSLLLSVSVSFCVFISCFSALLNGLRVF